MNLPSSLALSQSKLFHSRLGILLLALVGLAITGGLVLMRYAEPQRRVLPTPATSPAAQALPKAAAHPKQLVFYGPPAPSWAKPAVPYGPPTPPELALSTAPSVAENAAAVLPAAVTASGAATVVASGAATVATESAASAPTNVVAAASPVVALTPAATMAQAAPRTAIQTPVPALSVGSSAVGEIPKSVDASVLFARERFEYVGGGRRDPFQSLIDGKFQGQSAEASLIDVGDIHLVGIMWGSSDKFALVEDSRGHGYVLRVGDPVVNGYISGITKSDLQVVQNAFGESQSLSITMQTKEGDKNATRN